MSPAPVPPVVGPIPVKWYNSQRFKAYTLSLGMLVIGWLSQALIAGVWDAKALAVSALGIVALVLRDWASPAVEAPISAFNENNLQPWLPPT